MLCHRILICLQVTSPFVTIHSFNLLVVVLCCFTDGPTLNGAGFSCVGTGVGSHARMHVTCFAVGSVIGIGTIRYEVSLMFLRFHEDVGGWQNTTLGGVGSILLKILFHGNF